MNVHCIFSGDAGNGFCTGNFKEKDLKDAYNGIQRPDAGTPCAYGCIEQSEKKRWGNSYCYTDKIQWGAECVECKSMNFDYILRCSLFDI